MMAATVWGLSVKAARSLISSSSALIYLDLITILAVIEQVETLFGLNLVGKLSFDNCSHPIMITARKPLDESFDNLFFGCAAVVHSQPEETPI